MTTGRPLDIAIVGMACRFAAARDVDSFWADGRAGDVPPGHVDPDADDAGSTLLGVARTALADVGMAGGFPEGLRVEVVIGRESDRDRGNPARPPLGRIVAPTLAILRGFHRGGSDGDIEAVRARPAIVVEAAGVSSLWALDLGSRALIGRRADLALAGGIAFAVDRDGAEDRREVVVVVLKRLRDAERDGDRIYAVLKGIGLSSDGGGRGASSLARAHRRSGVDPATVGFVVTHKPGMAGVITAALALHHRVLPPTATTDAPPSGSARPWIHGDRTDPRRAGVDASGFEGIAAHAILEAHPRSDDADASGHQSDWETEAILLGAADRAAWLDRARDLLDWLDRGANRTAPLKDLAFTINTGTADPGFRVGLVVRSTDDLRDRLRAAAGRLADPGCRSIRDARGGYFRESPPGGPGTLAFLYPGEGSQYPGMLADLCMHFPEVRALFDTADRISREEGHARLPSEVVFGESGREGVDDLWTVGTAVNVVLSAQWALHQLLTRLGLRPDAVVGHSSGEFLALAASGALRVDQELEGRLGALARIFEGLDASGKVPTARLVAVAADRARVEHACRESGPGVTVAIDNCPHQVVIAGPPGAVEDVVTLLRARGTLCEPLPFDRAYHTGAFAEAVGPIRAFFDSIPLDPPRIPIYSCATASRMADDPEAIRRVAVEQWSRPVAFRATVEAMYADGVRIFVDVGARGNLAGFVEDILRGRPHHAVAANLPRRSGLTQLNHLVASLFAEGIALRPDHLYARRSPARIDLGVDLKPPARRGGSPVVRLPSELTARLRGLGVRETPPIAPPADAAFAMHLRTMETFHDVQRQVMDAYTSTRRRPGRDARAVVAVPGPWAGTVESVVPGRSLVAVRWLDMATDPVAEHHTLGGRRVSAIDPGRKGLPVVPFTVMAEMLAQAAAGLAPGRAVVGLRDVRAHRWIRYEEEPVALEIRAQRDPARPDEVHVEIRNRWAASGGHGASEGPVVTGRIVFGATRIPGPVALAFLLDDAGPSRFTAEELYADQWLFHGPALQALVRVGPISMDGIEGTLKVLPRRGLLRAGDRLAQQTDPIVLDAFTHLLGCWALDRIPGGEGELMFPLRVAELMLFGADPPEGSEVACRIRIREVARHRVRADADLVGPDGRVWVRISGWEDWRFHWPSRYRDQFRQPDRVFVGEPLRLTGEAGPARAVWLEPPAEMGKPVWRDVLEWVQLGPEERAAHRSLSVDETQRRHGLWGRIAAKEAARRLCADQGGPPIYPADLTIEAGPDGRLRLRSLAEPSRDDLPAIAMAHADGVAVALAAPGPDARLGIGIESVVGTGRDEFNDAERARLDAIAGSGHDRAEWSARFLAARGAVARAMGGRDHPGAVVVDADLPSGAVAVMLGPERTRAIRAVTARRGDHAWAWTLGEPIGDGP